jgi:hypothetical protein
MFQKKKPGTGGAPGFWILPRDKFAGGSAALFYKPASTQLVPTLPRTSFIGEAMNDLEAAHSVERVPTSPPSPEEVIEAPITVYSCRETDESYEGVIAREGDLRIVNCPDDLQWIVQRFSGGQWRNKSFHRTRRSLVQRYGALEMFRALPELVPASA